MPEVTESDVRLFAHHVLIDLDRRFVFFSIPKVACTEWIKLFRRIQGAADWRDNPHFKSDRTHLYHLPIPEATRILNDTGWYKAVFFRNPVERLLSAYLDKIVKRESYRIRLFQDSDPVSFGTFLDFVLDPNTDPGNPMGLHPGTDPHWRPQSLVGNVGKYIEQVDFVGDFSQLAEHARLLLQELGLWQEFGASGWGEDGHSEMFRQNVAPHRTDARELIEQYYSPDQATRTRLAYEPDFGMFRSIRPEQRAGGMAPDYLEAGPDAGVPENLLNPTLPFF